MQAPVSDGDMSPTPVPSAHFVNGLTESPLLANGTSTPQHVPIPEGPSLKRAYTEVDGTKISRKPRRYKTIRDAANVIMQQRKVTAVFKDLLSTTLCSICQDLQLTQDRFIIQDHSSDRKQQAYNQFVANRTNRSTPGTTSFPLGSGSGKFCLGSLNQIEKRRANCPLCLLVRQSLEVFHIEDLEKGKFKDAVCFASWQVDGREVTRDENGHVTSARPRTRRVQLRWDDPRLEDSYLVLIAPEPDRHLDFDLQTWESNTLFLGRNITSAGNNPALAKSWLDLCNNHHTERCRIERGEAFREMISSAFFGVVDVHEMRLTSLPEDKPYAALSYMWGEGTRYTTQLSNIQTHGKPGELGKIFASLPVVIQDAINLVRGLGLQYIWIDSLCIVQNSDKSWKLNSSVMDLVYGNADLTICAADGDNANAGLMGISTNRMITQHSQRFGKFRLMVSHLAETYVKKSVWNTRAWTFQERLLSKRCLIFAGGRVFFQCCSSAMSEDIVAEQDKQAWSIELVQAPLQLLLNLHTRPFWVYTECVRLYTARQLTHSRDVLAACNGLLNLIGQKLDTTMTFGLPSSHFDLALLWEPTRKCVRRQPQGEKQIKEFDGMVFPSWAWCGWQAPPSENVAMEYRKTTMNGCFENVHRWLAQHTWITWYIRDGKGNLRLVWDKSQHTKSISDAEERWSGYADQSIDGLHETDNYGRILGDNLKSLERSSFNQTLLEYPYKISIAPKRSPPYTPDQPFLQFWTWSAFLRIVPHEQTGSKLGQGLHRYDIADYTGDWCGTIVLDSDWSGKTTPGKEHEFIAISEAKEFSPDENDNWTYYIPKDREQADWNLYYVLLIKRDRQGIARREGLGKVFKDAFENSCLPGLKWREIILE